MEKKQGFDMLENADDKTMGRLSEINVLSAEEKARMFRASKEKYNQILGKEEVSVTGNDEGAEEMKIVEVKRKPQWMAFLAAAACLAVVCGIFKTGLHRGNTEDPDVLDAGSPVTSAVVTSQTEAADTDNAVSETAVTAKQVIVNVTGTPATSAETVKAESKAAEIETQAAAETEAVTEKKESTTEEKNEVTAETTAVTEKSETTATGEDLYKEQIRLLWETIEGGNKTLEYTLFDVNHDGVRELFVKYGESASSCSVLGYTLQNDGTLLCALEHCSMMPSESVFSYDTETDEFVIKVTRNDRRFYYWYELNDVSMIISREQYVDYDINKEFDDSIEYLDTAGLYTLGGTTYSYSEKDGNYTEKEGTDFEMFWNN